MELKEGYKNTEVGVIPEDWVVETLDDISELTSSKRIFESDYVSSGVPFYRGKEISLLNENKKLDEEYFISEEKYNGIKSVFGVPVKNDILITAVGTLGNIYLVPNNEKFYFKDGNLIWIRNIKKVLPEYLSIQLRRLRNEIINNAIGSSQKALTIVVLKKQFFPLPPTKGEQTAIATALSDADALINCIEKLIAKKRNIKQGAMQQLLKPKEGWEVKKLGNIGKPYGGLSGKSKLDFADGKFPYIPFMNIMSNPIIDTSYVDYVNIGVDENQNKALKGDLFFNGSSETPEEVGMCSVLLEDIPNLYLNSFCFGFRLNKDSKENGLYLSYYFRSSEGRKLFYSMAQGATRYNLSKSNFNKMEVSLPQPEQQNEIATILSDMDAEIQALETKLEKYRKLKLGMMQNLLTGKIRLI